NTPLANLISGSMISTSKEVKNISYLSCVDIARRVTPVSLFGITELFGLLILNKSTSHPKVFSLLGFRLGLIKPLSYSVCRDILPLKKLFQGLTELDKRT